MIENIVDFILFSQCEFMLSPKGPWLLQLYLTHSNYRPFQQRRCLQWLLSISVIGTRPMQVPKLLNRSLAFSFPHPAYSFKKSHFMQLMQKVMGLSRGKHEWNSIFIVISHKLSHKKMLIYEHVPVIFSFGSPLTTT